MLVLIPAAAYGVLFLGQRFPATERVQSGVSSGEMFRETFFRPLFWLLALSMMMTASVELGPNTWLTPVLEFGGHPGDSGAGVDQPADGRHAAAGRHR